MLPLEWRVQNHRRQVRRLCDRVQKTRGVQPGFSEMPRGALLQMTQSYLPTLGAAGHLMSFTSAAVKYIALGLYSPGTLGDLLFSLNALFPSCPQACFPTR